jgi:hypothetical protein
MLRETRFVRQLTNLLLFQDLLPPNVQRQVQMYVVKSPRHHQKNHQIQMGMGMEMGTAMVMTMVMATERTGQTAMEMMEEILIVVTEEHLMVVAHSLIDIDDFSCY